MFLSFNLAALGGRPSALSIRVLGSERIDQSTVKLYSIIVLSALALRLG